MISMPEINYPLIRASLEKRLDQFKDFLSEQDQKTVLIAVGIFALAVVLVGTATYFYVKNKRINHATSAFKDINDSLDTIASQIKNNTVNNDHLRGSLKSIQQYSSAWNTIYKKTTFYQNTDLDEKNIHFQAKVTSLTEEINKFLNPTLTS